MSLEITNNSTVDVVYCAPVFETNLITFTGAGTLKAGTILARDSSTLKLVPYVKGGATNENGIPKAVLRGELIATGAGDLSCPVIVEGQLRLSKLVINADGDSSNVDAAVKDQLRDYGMVVVETEQLAELDNQ